MLKANKSRLKILIVIAVIIIFTIYTYMSYRANYLQTLEIGEQYLEIIENNFKYKMQLFTFNFIVIFISIYITNKLIKKGLKPFFADEKKEVPKLPNKSLAFTLAVIFGMIVSNVFLEKFILFINTIWFGTSDPIFNMDIGFYFFQKPFILLIINYIMRLFIMLSLYVAVYYIIVFNQLLSGVDKEILKKSNFVKILRINAVFISLCVAAIVLLNTYDIVFSEFLTLKNSLNTKIIGAGISEVTIRLWGYRLLAIIIVISVILIAKSVLKDSWKKILRYILIVPAYLIILCFVMVLFNTIFVNSNKLDKEKKYIGYNIKNTKKAYGINTEDITLENAPAISENDLKENTDLLNNIPIVDEEVTLKNLNSLQTNSGYYTYRNAKLQQYIINSKETLVYVSPREISSSDSSTYNNKTFEYTHGFGSVISNSNKTTDNGNVDYIQKDFNSKNDEIGIKEPRIYYGLETNSTIITNTNDKKEFDYPITSIQSATYTYDGDGGIKLNLLDRFILSIMNKDINIAFANNMNDNSKVLINRNIIKRAKKVMPYLIYDEEPYIVVTDSGEQVWVIDAYTISDQYPYSQKSTLEITKGYKKEINYIRNSVKVLVNAYDGTVKFYITDKTDPIIMAYNKAYSGVFKEASDIPEDISKHFVYPKYLFNVQSDILKTYHNVTEDILYRGNDIWGQATYSANNSSTTTKKIQPYYTMLENDGKKEIGLIMPYTIYNKQNLTAYIVATANNDGSGNLKLYNYAQGSNIVGPLQLDKEIEQDETISKEIQSISVTGTKITKSVLIVPINNTILYVEPIYQQQLNEENAIPILKKVIVASGNKVAIGNNLQQALENLVSQYAVNIKVENTDTINDLISTIIEANKDLNESTKSGNLEMIGKDITKLQNLINQLENMKNNENKINKKEINQE